MDLVFLKCHNFCELSSLDSILASSLFYNQNTSEILSYKHYYFILHAALLTLSLPFYWCPISANTVVCLLTSETVWPNPDKSYHKHQHFPFYNRFPDSANDVKRWGTSWAGNHSPGCAVDPGYRSGLGGGLLVLDDVVYCRDVTAQWARTSHHT